MKYRAALIGCGNIGSLYANDPKIKGICTHAGAYTASSKTELVAVCDVDHDKVSACAKKWMVSHQYTDVKKMLIEQKPDVVSICTSDSTHADILECVLNTPGIKGVIVEKPLALDVNRAAELVRCAHEKKITLAVNYNRRHAKGHQKIKLVIENGDIGAVQKISGYYTKGILHNGTHWLDLARWLIGEITIVQGFNVLKSDDQDPAIDMWMQFQNGCTGFLQNVNAAYYSLFEMDIVGSNGRIYIRDSGHTIDYFDVCDSPFYTGYNTLKKQKTISDCVSNTLLSVVEDLLYSIERNVNPLCSDQDGLKVLQIAAAAVVSARNGNKMNTGEGNVDSIVLQTG